MAGDAALCKNHRDTAAAFACTPCGGWLCGACVKILGDGRTAQCHGCGGLAVPIGQAPGLRGPSVRAQDRPQPGFTAYDPLLERVLWTFGYLKQRSVLLTLAGLALFEWLGSFLGFSMFFGPALFVAWFIRGVKAAVFFQIVAQTADGNEELDPPDFSDVVDSVFAPALRYSMALLPLVIAVLWMGSNFFEFIARPQQGLAFGGPTILFFTWLALWPLMTCIAALGRSVFAMYDPRVWIDTLRRMGADYLVGAFAFYGVLVLEVLLWYPLLVLLATKVEIPLLGYVWAFLALLPWAWRARILGELCKPYMG